MKNIIKCSLNPKGTSLLRFCLLNSFFLLASACQTKSEFKDMSPEIGLLETQKSSFSKTQDNILAPAEYARFSKSLEAAVSDIINPTLFAEALRL